MGSVNNKQRNNEFHWIREIQRQTDGMGYRKDHFHEVVMYIQMPLSFNEYVKIIDELEEVLYKRGIPNWGFDGPIPFDI